MAKRNLTEVLNRLKQTMEAYSRELILSASPENRTPGKMKQSKIRREQIMSRILHLTQQTKNSLFSGNILDVTYIQRIPGQADRKFHAMFTDITKSDLEYFFHTLSSTQKGLELDILEIREIPTFIKEVPL